MGKHDRLFLSFFLHPMLGVLTGFSVGSIIMLALNPTGATWHHRAFALAAIPLMAHRMVLSHRLRRMGSVPSSALPTTNTRVDPALARGRFTRTTAKVVDTEIR